jgi:two-component system chemotaxis response regulator CheY
MADDPKSGDERAPDEHEFYDRRSGEDRRGGGERRGTGRRYRRLDVDDDRRSGEDRRKGAPRRRIRDRRRRVDPRYKKHHSTDARPVYSAEDVARVQRMLSRVGFGVTCPVCEGPFTLGPVDVRGTDTVRQATCANCGRGTVVTNCILMRVMVVTRIPAVRTMLRGIVTSAGHEVLEPAHAGAALEVQRETPADVVIMDPFALTEMDGQELIRQLRRDYPDLRIVVLAPKPTYRSADPSATARQLGASHIVRTPFSREDLLRALREPR